LTSSGVGARPIFRSGTRHRNLEICISACPGCGLTPRRGTRPVFLCVGTLRGRPICSCARIVPLQISSKMRL
jgi:hypothetical protein